MNPLPPQAYTKDTLVQAYAWLQGQNDSVKEIATNPDILVSLYLKAKMQGDHFFERPSIQNFKNELKSLAGMIGEFEQNPNPRTPPTKDHQQTDPGSIVETTLTKTPKYDISGLDEKSQQMIREVKNSLNLSCESEALRLVIAIGFQKTKNLL